MGECAGHPTSVACILTFGPSLPGSSLTVTRHHRTLAAARYRPRYLHLSTRPVDGRSWRLSGPVALYSSGSRFVSTVPPPTREPVTNDAPPPPANAVPRKPKVDMRPAPVKPSKTETSPPPEYFSSAQSSTPPAAEPAHETHTSHNPSIVESAKQDYNDAAEHGILKPPPADASWAGRLYHQAKELFVRAPFRLHWYLLT